ncbi:ankyrin repeat domain-containing protein [Amycolatopsis sp. NPDC051071]|uniref:ankyrin repeat domain-containing protein n=1 Tax=Amycolatopsis sp. NPDC051071 TaxID=3154637 RepID=UPI003438606B
MTDLSPAHQAFEMGDLPLLRELLDGGADINEEHYGLTLLHHAIDVEIDSHTQTGEPLHVDVTAYLLARGADPKRRSDGGSGVTAEHVAWESRHWLASALFAGRETCRHGEGS